jgi:hypothetical protein
MKKFSLLSSFFMAIFMVFSVTAVNAAITVPEDKPIYPAVYQAIQNGHKSVWSESRIANITDPNIVVINNVRTNDLLNVADFTLQISVENKVVNYRFSNIKTRGQLSTTWTNRNDFASKTAVEKSFTDFFDAEISKIMANDSLYAQAKQTADQQNWAPRAAIANAPVGTETLITLPLQNPNNFPLYPAMGAALNATKSLLGAKTAAFATIDTLDDIFVIDSCVAERGRLDLVEYKIKIEYKDNNVNIAFFDVEKMSKTAMFYDTKDFSTFSKFDTQNIANQLKTKIEQTLINTTAYNTAKKEFLENNAFLYRAFSSVSNALKDEFIEKMFKGEVSFSVRVGDVKKNDKAAFSGYSYEIDCSCFMPVLNRIFLTVKLYTSDAVLARLKPGETLVLSGQFANYEDRSYPQSPILSMTK